MQTIKVKRHQVIGLWNAIDRCIQQDIPMSFRYAITRTSQSIKDEIMATVEAYQKKEPSKDNAEEHEKWAKEYAEHMNQDVEIKVHKTDIVEIRDNNPDLKPEEKWMADQRLLELLMPMLN